MLFRHVRPLLEKLALPAHASRVSKKCARRCVDLHQRPARCLGSVIGYLVCAEAIMLASAPIVLTPEYTQRGEVADTANQAPDAVAARRPRGRNRLADVIFKALCLLIVTFVISVFGIVGGFYLYITR
jgi:hypothetical protein